MWMAPGGRCVPLAALAVLLGVYLAEGAVGASVVDRYLLGAATMLLPFCAVTIGGWAMLRPGTALRRVWIAGAAALVRVRRRQAAATLSLSSLRTTLAYHEDFHKGLAAALADPRVERPAAALPAAVAAQQQADPRRALDPRHRRPARHRGPQPGARGRRPRARTRSRTAFKAGSVAVYPLGSAVFVEAIVDVGDDPRDQVPAEGLQARLHEPLLRGLCELLSGRAGAGRAAAPRARRTRGLAWAALAAVLGGGPGAAAVGRPPGAAVRLQHRRGRPLRAARGADVRRGHARTRTTSPTRPAFTYLLHFLFALWFGGRRAVLRAFRAAPAGALHARARAAALLGTAALWLLYATGARLFGRGVGLLAAAIEAVAFLPVFYSHLALNDVPTLAPLTLSLLGSAGVLRKGRARATTCSPASGSGSRARPSTPPGSCSCPAGGRGRGALPATASPAPVAACAARAAGGRRRRAGRVPARQPLRDPRLQRASTANSSTSPRCRPKRRASSARPQDGGLAYYLWSLTWGLGWVPALAALGGAVAVWRHERRLGWLLVPAPLLFLAFMGLQGRYFGRWLLPIFPMLCLLAAFFAARVADRRRAPARRAGRARRSRWAGLGDAAARSDEGKGIPCAQAAVGAGGRGAARPGPRLQRARRAGALARRHAQPHRAAGCSRTSRSGAPIVVEPVSPDDWADDQRPGSLRCTRQAVVQVRLAALAHLSRTAGCCRDRRGRSRSRTMSARWPRR